MTTLARAIIALSLFFLTSAAAIAQSDTERTQVFASWSLEVSQFSSSAVNLMGDVNTAVDVISQYNSGDLSNSAAQAQIRALRQRVDARLGEFESAAERLSRGPALAPVGMEDAARSMADMPDRTLDAIRSFRDTTFTFADSHLAGENPDAAQVDIARFEVMKTYYLGLAASNEGARNSVAETFPQYHLLNAFVLNSRSTAFAFELARQALGAPPSSDAPSDIPGMLERNRTEVLASAQRTRALQAQTLQLVNSQPASALGATEAQVVMIRNMLNTYTASAEAEVRMANALVDAPSVAATLAETGSWGSWDRWIAGIAEDESIRDANQMERQRLAAGQ